MMSENLPLLIGITGHRDALIRDEYEHDDPKNLTETIKAALQAWRLIVGENTPIWLLSGMAVGPDLLAIEAIESLMEESQVWSSQNTDIIPVLPMPLEHFLKDFSDTDRESKICFEYYLNKYKDNLIIVTPEMSVEDLEYAYHDMDYGQQRNLLYLNQGAFLSRYSNILLAAWDGQDSEKIGGTADVVKMKCGITHALENSIHQSLRNVSRFDGQNGGLVHHLPVERLTENTGESITPTLLAFKSDEMIVQASLYVCCDCNSPEKSPLFKSLHQEFSVLLPQLKHFNTDKSHTTLQVDSIIAKGLGRVGEVFTHADQAALASQKRYRKQISWFMCTAIFAFMAYEVISNVLNTALGFVILSFILVSVAAAILLIHWSKKARHKWHYQLNRMVAEALRLRCFLNLGGVPPSTKPMMPRRYRAIFPIVTQAIAVGELIWWQKRVDLNIADAKNHWIDDQIKYLERKLVNISLPSYESLSWLHAHPKMAMIRFSGLSKALFYSAIGLGLIMLLLHGVLLSAYPGVSLTTIMMDRCVVNDSILGFWCQWDFLIMMGVQFLVMLGGVIALWIELANYRASTAGFEGMLLLYQKAQALMSEDLSDNEIKELLNELSREAMQEHIEWNFSEEDSDLAKR